MENKMVTYLQELLDNYVEANVHGWCWADELANNYNACKAMVEAVTGKKVNTHEWRVSLVDEIPGIEIK